MREFGIKEQEIIFVNSYHSKIRKNWNKVYVFPEKQCSVNLMEPDDINCIFSRSLNLTYKSLIICFTGAGLPQNDNLVSLIATGQIAELCNTEPLPAKAGSGSVEFYYSHYCDFIWNSRNSIYW